MPQNRKTHLPFRLPDGKTVPRCAPNGRGNRVGDGTLYAEPGESFDCEPCAAFSRNGGAYDKTTGDLWYEDNCDSTWPVLGSRRRAGGKVIN
jgi:hypothetical protein